MDQDALKTQNRQLGFLCAIAIVFLFSSFTLVSKLGFNSSLKLIDIAALRFFTAGLFMLPVLLHFGLAGLRWRDTLLLAFLGGFGFALFAYTGLSLAPASHGASLLHGTLPLFSYLLAQCIERTHTSKTRVFGLLALCIGIALMIWDSVTVSTVMQLLGDGSLLLASICWSGYGLLAQRLKLKPAHSASIIAVFSMCSFLPVYLLSPDKGMLHASWTEIVLQGLFQGLLIASLSIFIYSKAVSILGAVQTAVFMAAVPCITTVAAIFLLNEIPSSTAIGGVLVVSIGMAFAMKTKP